MFTVGTSTYCVHFDSRAAGEPEQAKGANGMQLYVVGCIVYVVDAKRDECLLV